MLRMECNHCGKTWETYMSENCPDCESGEVLIRSEKDVHECDRCHSEQKILRYDFTLVCQGCGRKWKLIHGLLEES